LGLLVREIVTTGIDSQYSFSIVPNGANSKPDAGGWGADALGFGVNLLKVVW